MISRGQGADDIELITDVNSDNVIEEKSTKSSLFMLFLIAVSLLMLEE